jgi:hypothetical protein
MKCFRLFPIALGAVVLPLSASASFLVNHNLIGDLDRTNQDLPDQAAWWKGGGSAIELNPTVNGLSWLNTGGGSRLVSTNFVDNDASSMNTATLGLGDILVAEYTFSPSNVGGGSLTTGNRFFLVGTAGATSARFLADNTSTANGPSVSGLVGYGLNFQVSSAMSEQALTIRKIDSSLSSNFSSNGSFLTLPTTVIESGAGDSLVSSGTYTVRLTLDYTVSGQVSISGAILDASSETPSILASVSAVDTAGIVNTFDALIYRTGGDADAGGSHLIKNWSVGVTVIPEPSALGLLFGGFAAAMLIGRRRR